MSKNSNLEPNAPPPYDSQITPVQGGVYPHLGFQEPPQAPCVPPQSVQYNAQATPQVVHVTQVSGVLVGPEPVKIQCPSCQAQITSEVTHESTMKTHLCALVFCLIGCWPCVLLPYCMSTCKDTMHNCPNCKTFLGIYKK